MKIQLRPRMFVLFISLGLLLLSVLDTGADQARYIYDDVGRLYRVIDEQGNVATYHYDAVGNIVGIERGAADAGPRVSGISPGVGAVDSLFDVVISGSGLSGSSVVADNPGINVSNVQTADSVITARFSISSTASLGPANITVSNVLGTAQTVLVIKPAAIHLDSVSPSSGLVTRQVQITGKGFSSTPSENTVFFNSVAAPVYHSSPSTIMTAVPAGATSGPLTVVKDGLSSNALTFEVTEPQSPPPTIASISPDGGMADGGSRVTITGSGFTSDTKVSIGSQVPWSQVVSSLVIHATTAPHQAGKCDVLVTNINGDAIVPDGFTYADGPCLSVMSISPASGSTNVPINSSIAVLFTRPVNPATVNADTFLVVETDTGSPLAGAFSLDCGNTLVNFKPAAGLRTATKYSLTIKTGIRSVEGVPLDNASSGSFTTGTSADDIPPTVTVSPADGAVGLPINAIVRFDFSEPMDTATINNSTLMVTNNGNSVPGLITFSQDRTVAAFASSDKYLANSSVKVALYGKATDVAGNPIMGSSGVGTDLVSSFGTTSTSDMVAPRVLSIDPPDKATEVNASASVTVTFSEPINTVSVDSGTFVVSVFGADYPGNIIFSSNNTVATFVPSSSLPLSSDVSITLGKGITDMAGNATPLYSTSTFRTQESADTSPPNVIAIDPPDGQMDVPTNSRIHIAFDEPVHPLTLSGIYLRDSNGNLVQGDVSLTNDGRLAVFTPAEPLQPYTTFHVYYSQIRDIAGNFLANPGVTSFTAGAEPDYIPPEVDRTTPANGAKDVPINSRVSIKCSESIDQTSVNNATFVISQGGTPVAGSFSFDLDGRIVIFQAAEMFLPGTLYEVRLTTGIRDTAGNGLAREFTAGFTTGLSADVKPPSVSGTSPYDGATDVPTNSTITIVFDEPVDPLTLNGTTIQALMPFALSVSTDSRTVTLTPTEALAANSGYWVTYSENIRDISGNPLANSGSINFTTGNGPDSTAPLVLETCPAHGATDVPTNFVLLIRFSEPVSPTSVNANTIVVSRNGTPAAGALSFDPLGGNRIVRFQMTEGGQPGTSYEVRVTNGVTDVAGKPLALEYTAAFTTGSSEDSGLPDVVSVVPADGATNVSCSTAIEAIFTEPIDPITLNETTFKLVLDDLPPFTGTYAVSADGKKVTFTPASPLLAGHQGYSLTLAGIEDLAGHPLPEKSYHFGAALAAGTDPAALPSYATVFTDPSWVYPDGLSTAVIQITDVVNSNNAIVPDGTPVAVTIGAFFGAEAGGGTLIDGSELPGYPGFKTITVTGGAASLTFRAANLPDLPFGRGVNVTVQVLSLDAEGHPVSVIGSAILDQTWGWPD